MNFQQRLFTMEIDHGLNEMKVQNWITDEAAEVQQLLDGLVKPYIKKSSLFRLNSQAGGSP